MTFTIRKAVRVFLINRNGELLLINGADPSTRTDSWWFTVGGGIKQGESTEEALSREIQQETGQHLSAFIPTPFSRWASFCFNGRRYNQYELYFQKRTDRFEPIEELLTYQERNTFLGYRWWNLQEIEATKEIIYPPELPGLFEYLKRNS